MIRDRAAVIVADALIGFERPMIVVVGVLEVTADVGQDAQVLLHPSLDAAIPAAEAERLLKGLGGGLEFAPRA